MNFIFVLSIHFDIGAIGTYMWLKQEVFWGHLEAGLAFAIAPYLVNSVQQKEQHLQLLYRDTSEKVICPNSSQLKTHDNRICSQSTQQVSHPKDSSGIILAIQTQNIKSTNRHRHPSVM